MFHWIETSSKVILMEPSDFPTRETVYAKIRADLDQYGWSLISSIYRDELFTHTVGLAGATNTRRLNSRSESKNRCHVAQ